MINNLSFKTLIFTVAGIFVGSFSLIARLTLAKKVIGWPAWKQDISMNSRNDQNYFSVDGKTTVEAIPDQAVVNLGVDITAKTVADAQNQANTIVTNLQTQLSGLNIEKKDIQTKNYSLYPNYDWKSDGRSILSYTVNSTLQITCKDFAVLNQIIDQATAVGINQVNGIDFTLSDAKQAELKKQARQQAIAKAKENAQELANLTGIKLGNLTNVYEYEPDNRTDTGIMYAKNLMALGDAEDQIATSVEAGTASYNYQVTLTYQTF